MSSTPERRVVKRLLPEQLRQITEITPELFLNHEARLNEGDRRMTELETMVRENTDLTRLVYENTSGFRALQGELANGARFLCRLAKGITFVQRLIEKSWKAALIAYLLVYLTMHDFTLPDWLLTFWLKVIL